MGPFSSLGSGPHRLRQHRTSAQGHLAASRPGGGDQGARVPRLRFVQVDHQKTMGKLWESMDFTMKIMGKMENGWEILGETMGNYGKSKTHGIDQGKW